MNEYVVLLAKSAHFVMCSDTVPVSRSTVQISINVSCLQKQEST